MYYKKHSPFFDENKNGWFKFCTPCGQIKPLEQFKATKKRVLCCKICFNLKKRKAYNRKPLEERSKIAKRKVESRTPEQIEKFKTYQKKWRAKPEIKKRILESQRRRYKTWTKDQKEKYREVLLKGVRAYQARKRNALIIISFTKADIIRRDGLSCYLCDKKLTEKSAIVEHLIPLSRGGNHKPENVKISCAKCNNMKHNKTVTEYKKSRGDYDRFKISAISSNVYL